MLKFKLSISLINLISLISLTLLVPPALAHNFGPIPSTGCGSDHTPNTGLNTCIHSGGNAGIGTINPGNSIVPTASGDPSALTASIVKSIITLLLTVAFIIALIWNILAGLKFITSNGDPKGISEAWSRIYWGIIGLVVVVGSFAIIKMVEAFFHIDIITGGLKLPTI